MENQNENPELLNQEHEEITVDDNDTIESLKEKINKISDSKKQLSDTNRQLFARAKQAEGFEKDGDGKWIKIQKPEPKKPEVKLSKKSDELDYAQIAFHNSKSNVLRVETPEDEEFLKSQIEESGKSTKEVLNSKWFNVLYKEHKEAQVVDNAVPQSAGSRTNQVPANRSVEYWLSKGDFEFPEDKPENRELILKIIDARTELKKKGL